MLSFFSKKKHSPPDTPPEEVIQGPDSQANSGDDFIFVEKKPPAAPVYPPMLPAFGSAGLPYPGPYNPTASRPSSSVLNNNTTPIPYVQGVPFELAPELCQKNVYEVTQMQVDGILALLTRQMSVEEDYSFTLERAVQSECY